MAESSGLKITQRLRPSAFAAYSAWSAASSTESAEPPWSGKVATQRRR